jgi:hypothetical protein
VFFVPFCGFIKIGFLIHYASVVKIFGGFLHGIENDPVSPNDRSVLPAGLFDGGIAMILVAIIIIRV